MNGDVIRRRRTPPLTAVQEWPDARRRCLTSGVGDVRNYEEIETTILNELHVDIRRFIDARSTAVAVEMRRSSRGRRIRDCGAADVVLGSYGGCGEACGAATTMAKDSTDSTENGEEYDGGAECSGDQFVDATVPCV